MLDGRHLRTEDLLDAVAEARAGTLAAIADLETPHLLDPRGATINPLLWEVGHVAWFQERRATLRDGGDSILERADGLFDSIAVPHEVRWELELPDRGAMLWYLEATRDAAIRDLERAGDDPVALHRHAFAVFHEDMHGEAFRMMRQTLGWPAARRAPRPTTAAPDGAADDGAGRLDGDVDVPGGPFTVGATERSGFAFDNEKWGVRVELAPFSIARAPVTDAEFAEFTDGGGYRDRALWSDAGWAWRRTRDAEHPAAWRRSEDGSFERRTFDGWAPLAPHHPVVHISWYEAEAYCRWAGRRLPTEAEWEAAALLDPGRDEKRHYPWGDDAPTPRHANLDAALGPVDVGACAAGDSALGCRQMLGNVWEWTADWFAPFEGFRPDHYREYSQSSFGMTKVLKGGAWTTRSRMIRGTWRNFYEPRRNDAFAGFRTCAIR